MQERHAYFATLPGFDFRVISDAGHWVAYEAPDQFNLILRAMIERAG
jgi:pimeloyl-ACP methyl ester carboxylesterase